MRILITGQSGISIKSAIDRFIQNYNIFNINNTHPIFFKLEDIIHKNYCKKKGLKPDKKSNWDKFLKETYKVQEEYWNSSFDELLSLADQKEKEENCCIILNIHAVYYHRRTQEYISLVNIDRIRKFNPNKIITLIDDIYDIRHRLSRSPQDIFYVRSDFQDMGDYGALKIIFDLKTTLDWRAKEIMISRFIAKELDKKAYVFAVKHSWDIFYQLILGERKTIYLSHPISEPRRLEFRGLAEKAKDIKSEIVDLSELLKNKFIAFLPTTIDEWRMRTEKKDGVTIYYTVLNPRWDHEKYLNEDDSLFIPTGFLDEDELWKRKEIAFPDKEFNYVLMSLADQVAKQVTVRDLTLVEQSDLLVVYRPFFNGNPSGGVKEENEYFEDLVRVVEILGGKNEKGKVYIYCPEDDIQDLFRNQFDILVKEKLKSNHLTQNDGGEFETITDKEFSLLSKAGEDEEDLIEALKTIMANHKLKFHIQMGPDSKPLDDIEKILNEYEKSFILEYKKKTFNILKFYQMISEEFITENNVSPAKFVETIQKYYLN